MYLGLGRTLEVLQITEHADLDLSDGRGEGQACRTPRAARPRFVTTHAARGTKISLDDRLVGFADYRAIFEKSGASSRGELVARLFFDHYAPRLTTSLTT